MSARPRLHPRRASLACCLLLGLAAGGDAVAQALPEVPLRIGAQHVTAEVATTRAQRETGLMNRRALGRDHGMLFVFRQEQDVCMWMKNTYVPLSVAFIASDGSIRRVADMRPLTLDAHCAGQPVRYALEMPLGWFTAHHVAKAAVVGGLPAAGAAGE